MTTNILALPIFSSTQYRYILYLDNFFSCPFSSHPLLKKVCVVLTLLPVVLEWVGCCWWLILLVPSFHSCFILK